MVPPSAFLQVLQDVSLAVEPGRVLALCGASGGGKSSVVALLQRWCDLAPADHLAQLQFRAGVAAWPTPLCWA